MGSIKQFIGCDEHKRYSVYVSMDETGIIELAGAFEWPTAVATNGDENGSEEYSNRCAVAVTGRDAGRATV